MTIRKLLLYLAAALLLVAAAAATLAGAATPVFAAPYSPHSVGQPLLPSIPGGQPAMAPGQAFQAPTPEQLEAQGYERILTQRRGRFTKAGWNHYGPGYFDLDQQTGVLSGHGGMGLLWYSVKEYSDFILELDFMTGTETANSGVFVRVPGVPSSDDYIYHSWEIQIDDRSEGIHHTGAVYDAEAPSKSPSNGPGVWNHYKITCVGNHITVELNGEKVVDWDAEPRGKVLDFTTHGYVGIQNHDRETSTQFRNIFIKPLN